MPVKIASAQFSIDKHASLEEWRLNMEKWVLDAVNQKADLLLFPEYASLDLASLLPEDLRVNTSQLLSEIQYFLPFFIETFQDLAEKYAVIIVAPSFLIKTDTGFSNRVFVFSQNKRVASQDKLFMTRTEMEEWEVGEKTATLTVFEAEWGKFGIQTCYDSEFAIGTQQLAKYGAELVLIPSCTKTGRGAARVHIGARARAMEQQLYVVVSQLVNPVEWLPLLSENYGYAGFYTTPDNDLPEDGILSVGTPQKEGWIVEEIDFEKTRLVRNKGEVANFKDHSEVSTRFKNRTFVIETISLI